MFDLKPIHEDAIPAALEKAMRYRLLNEPAEAESICLDVLNAEPDNQLALTTLLLALTDRFGATYAVGSAQAQEALGRIRDPYEQAYYAGIIRERLAKARLAQHIPGARFHAYDLFLEALAFYQKADDLRPPGNDDARLRWNTCVRLIQRNQLMAHTEDTREPPFD
jgi:hypothetical protein